MIHLDRCASFIEESNRIEDVGLARQMIVQALITGTSKGHVGAFLEFRRLAQQRQILCASDLFLAHRLILLEQLELEMPEWKSEDGLPPDIAPEVGGWRRRNVSVGSHQPPGHPMVPAIMADFFDRLRSFFSAARGNEEAIDFAADSHWEYEMIHPFIDGNGRTGRLIANYILLFHSLPIAVFTSVDKNDYYGACDSADSAKMRTYLRQKMA